MRKITTTDLFAAMRLIKAAGVKDEIKKIALQINESKKEINQREVGAELLLSIVEGLAEKKAEASFYEFLAGPFEMDSAEIAALTLDDLFGKFKELGKMMDPEGWQSFFKSLAASIK